MDIARPEFKTQKRRRQLFILAAVILGVAAASVGVSRLPPRLLPGRQQFAPRRRWEASCCESVFIVKNAPGAFVVSSLLFSARWLRYLIEIFRWILYLRGGRVGSCTWFRLPQAVAADECFPIRAQTRFRRQGFNFLCISASQHDEVCAQG
jgi:hypothetical protein